MIIFIATTLYYMFTDLWVSRIFYHLRPSQYVVQRWFGTRLYPFGDVYFSLVTLFGRPVVPMLLTIQYHLNSVPSSEKTIPTILKISSYRWSVNTVFLNLRHYHCRYHPTITLQSLVSGMTGSTPFFTSRWQLVSI